VRSAIRWSSRQSGVELEIDEIIFTMFKEIMSALVALQAAVAAQTSVIASAETLLTSLGTQLTTVEQQLAAGGADTTDLQAVITNITSNTSGLAAAVAANTPAAPAPAPVAVPPAATPPAAS
jgi:hypothetical protein